MKIPEDEELRKIIDKLANFVARNGPKFEELTKSKQKDNPKFSFLFGGDYHEYYKWKVNIEATQIKAQQQHQQPLHQPLPQPLQQPPQQPASNNIVLTQSQPALEEKEEKIIDLTDFKELLQKLIEACTKENIQNGKNWVVNNGKSDKELKKIFKHLLRRMLEEDLPFQQKLHIVYLANDILHHGRKKNLPQLQENMIDYILPIVAMAYQDTSPDGQAKLSKVLNIWDTQGFFPDKIREDLKKGWDLVEEQKERIRTERSDMERENVTSINNQTETTQQLPQHQQHSNPYQTGTGLLPPPTGQFPPYNNQEDMHMFNQWNAPQPGPPDPYHYCPPHGPPPPMGFQPGFQPGFPPQMQMPAQGSFQQQQQPPQYGGPPPQVQTFDYSHQSLPNSGAAGGGGGGGGGGPMTFDYEHGKAPVPDGAPAQEEMRDPTIPLAPYFDLPAGLMVPLVKLWDCEYKPLDPKEIRLPIPQPPSERLLAAIEAFYSLPSHDRPRDINGWEKNGLFEFYKAKLKHIVSKEKNMEVFDRTPSPPQSPTEEFHDDEIEKLIRDNPDRDRSTSRSPVSEKPRSRSRSGSRGRKRSYSRSRSRSNSRSPKRRSRSASYSRSRSTSPVRRQPIERSPTPPEAFVGFETRTLDSRIEESNVGHQLLKKMGWGGQGLGKNEHGVVDPIRQGEVRDKQDKFKGVGLEMNDPFENYRKTKSYTYGKPRERK